MLGTIEDMHVTFQWWKWYFYRN